MRSISIQSYGFLSLIVHGQWSLWSNWTDCSTTCGNGTQSRNRTCTNPFPQHGGQDCVGNKTQYRSCDYIRKECPSKTLAFVRNFNNNHNNNDNDNDNDNDDDNNDDDNDNKFIKTWIAICWKLKNTVEYPGQFLNCNTNSVSVSFSLDCDIIYFNKMTAWS